MNNESLTKIGTLHGEEIYFKKELFEFPSSRMFKCLQQIYFLENFKADKEEIESMISELEKSFNKGDFIEVGTIVTMLKIKLDSEPEMRSYVDLASNFFYLKGEGDKITSDNVQKKKSLFSKDYNESAFFLQFLMKSATKFNQYRQKSSDLFLEEMKKHLKFGKI